MATTQNALTLCLILLLAPLAGCLDLNEGSQGDEGVNESCVDFDYSDLNCLDFGLPDENGLMALPMENDNGHGDHHDLETEEYISSTKSDIIEWGLDSFFNRDALDSEVDVLDVPINPKWYSGTLNETDNLDMYRLNLKESATFEMSLYSICGFENIEYSQVLKNTTDNSVISELNTTIVPVSDSCSDISDTTSEPTEDYCHPSNMDGLVDSQHTIFNWNKSSSDQDKELTLLFGNNNLAVYCVMLRQVDDTFTSPIRFTEDSAPAGPSGPGGISFTPTCTSSDLVPTPNSADLISYLATVDSSCLRYLWYLDSAVSDAMNSQNVADIYQELIDLEPTFDGTNTDAHMQLMMFARIAGYHEWYNSIPALTSNVHLLAEQMVTDYGNNANFLLINPVAGAIVYQFVNIADIYDLSYLIVGLHVDILEQFSDPVVLDSNYAQGSVLYTTLMSIARQAWRPEYRVSPDMSSLSDNLEILAVDANSVLQDAGHTWVVNCAIFSLYSFSYNYLPSYYAEGFWILVDAQSTHLAASPNLFSTPFLWATKILDIYYDCSHPAVSHCVDDVVPILESQLFPNQYSFDDGTIVFQTPLNVEDVQVLYHAAKEVQSQFNRLTMTIQPVDNDPNDVLTIVIYGSRADYVTYQGFLYGLGTNNGGIYIEHWGKFFTYQRTAQESIYTLEELFRHEYVHFLVGRHLIEGMWGDSGSIYDNDRMTWLDEGLAEYLTWSTDDEGVPVRAKLVQQISNDGTDRMDISEIVSSTYSHGWKFYRYSCLFFDYLHQYHLDDLIEILQYAHFSDITAFDAKVAYFATDQTLNNGFHSHLDDLIDDLPNLTDPTTTFPPVDSITYLDLDLIQSEFQSVNDCTLSVIDTNPRFTCSGVLSSIAYPTTPTTSELWYFFDNELTQIQSHMKGLQGYNNFDQLTCRFSNIRVGYTDSTQTDQYGQAEYYCDGPLPQGTYNRDPSLQLVTEDITRLRLGANANCVEVNPTFIQCTSTYASQLYEDGTPFSVLETAFENDVYNLENQLFGKSPTFYSDLECITTGTPSEVEYAYGDGIYLSGNWQCDVNL